MIHPGSRTKWNCNAEFTVELSAQAQQASHCLYIPSKTSKCSTGDKGGEQTKGRQTRRPPTPGSQGQLLLDTKPQLRKNTAALPIAQTGINPPKSRKPRNTKSSCWPRRPSSVVVWPFLRKVAKPKSESFSKEVLNMKLPGLMSR